MMAPDSNNAVSTDEQFGIDVASPAAVAGKSFSENALSADRL